MTPKRYPRSIRCIGTTVHVSNVGPVAGGYLFGNYFRPILVGLTGDVERDLVFVGVGAPGANWFVGRATKSFDLEDLHGGRP